MTKSLFLVFNHKTTPAQRTDAEMSLEVTRFVPLPTELKSLWARIPPGLNRLGGYLAPVRKWLTDQATPGDFVLIQGDFGATVLLVCYALEKGLVPVYSTTEREAREIRHPDGSVEVIHRIRHVAFRKYAMR